MSILEECTLLRKYVLVLLCFFLFPLSKGYSEEVSNDAQKRMALYKKMETLSLVPWYYFAAMDQYEANIRAVRRDIPDQTGTIAIYIKPEAWAGIVNPNINDTNPKTISIFGGIGLDGDDDGVADRENSEDILYTIVKKLNLEESNKSQVKTALWNYYHRAKAVELIMEYAKLYQHFGTVDIKGSSFPVPLHTNYSYKNTWGAARGFGGRRSHEGTDIFAGYGVPVRSTCYGIIETKGWNKYGGWRIGIRDLSNTYHYYAHMGGFSKDIAIGQVVEPGHVIGFVGSTGYGPPGTAGKFPPHLHFGMYKDNGYTEWSFDPYPHLQLWERTERMKKNQ